MNLDLAVLARAPVPGQCKTRLIPALGAEGAADLHTRLVRHTLNQAMQLPSAQVTLWTAGDPQHLFFEQLNSDWPTLKRCPQPEGDLGQRMHQVFVSNNRPTLLMGSDCPLITPELLEICAQSLSEKHAVFLPAEDGGYALVGLNQPCPAIFQNLSWGTEQVMQQTRAIMQELGVHWSEPQVVWDVDRPEDVQRLKRKPFF
ncbi:hypothetical protein SAMN05660443_0125 [Marinospirillum celere]|uniref:Glycosyltransferase n=1 Tax=Marinospirillum celere TaxID=1122252 RepID=A0A1I1DV55_9GAMM|nr:TIGR04282 family arsenosugar biosynthesis glycosyltransferase [Marinospirillum celere]SFB78761.1 hypothetical protein SAMN05660443_0125 [Marinospirillum celere]